MPDTDWEQRAACRNWVEVFDPTFDSSGQAVVAAAEVYGECPVQRESLQEALAVETSATRHRMRGGLMPAQRSRLARQSA